MKTSSGLLLGVLFTLVVVIVAVVIYFNTRPEEEKTATPTGPSPTLPTIGGLTVSQTLSPNSNSETYTIEPYTIEAYEEGDNEKSLSKNVTFTLNWRNEGSFEDVTEIKVEHYIKIGDVTTKMSTRSDTSLAVRSKYTDVSFPVSGLPDDLPDATEKKQYSFVGKSRFKILAVMSFKTDGANYDEVTLYNGIELGDEDPAELEIKASDLTATIDMAQALTKTYSLKLRNESKSASSAITNTKYTFMAAPLKKLDLTQIDTTKSVTYQNVELFSQDDEGKTFKFRSDSGYWGIQSVAESADNKAYKKLITNVSEANAVLIRFVNSSLDKSDEVDTNGVAGDNYKSFKIVIKENDVDVDYYLHGIKDKVGFRTLNNLDVNTSAILSHTRHWLIT